MNKSDSLKELATALSKAQGEFQNAKRDKENPFFHSKYADLTSLWDICRPVLSKNGLSVAQGPSVNENHVTIKTLLMHNSGEWIESELILNADKPTAQGVGSAITYGRRYSLAAMLGLVADDDGNEASKAVGKKQQKKADPPPPKKTEQKAIDPETTARQKIINEIGVIVKNDKFTDEDRAGVRVEISLVKTNIGLEAIRAVWQGKLNRLEEDFKDDDPEKSAENDLFADDEKTVGKEAGNAKGLDDEVMY